MRHGGFCWPHASPQEEKSRGARILPSCCANLLVASSHFQHKMSDHEVETFESADAGASLTYPQQAGTVRKNGYLVISGHPCKVQY